MYKGTKFTRALSDKMQHSEKTHTEWYEGHARRTDMLTVVKQDFSTSKLHISNTLHTHHFLQHARTQKKNLTTTTITPPKNSTKKHNCFHRYI